MASEGPVPDTDSTEVAALAIAWEIVRIIYNVPNMLGATDTGLERVTNAVIKVQEAIVRGEPIEK